jgi:1-carboxybiuret hydrolase subunit AtzG-like protein
MPKSFLEIRPSSPCMMVENQLPKSEVQVGEFEVKGSSPVGGGANGTDQLHNKQPPSGSNAKMSTDNLDPLIAASARAIDLPVDPAWHPAIRFNLEVTLRFAALVASFPLPDDAEPAPVFRA